MHICNCRSDEFIEKIGNERIICFGAGVTGKAMVEHYIDEGILDRIDFFCDNDPQKWGKKIEIAGHEYEIISPVVLEKMELSNTSVFVVSRFWDEICEQLNKMTSLTNVRCFVYILFKTYGSGTLSVKNEKISERIPKRIFYCWFGPREMPDREKKCIESWEKYCPDYEIVRISEENYDIAKTPYLREVSERGYYTAVSNVARFESVYSFGGLYFDTDVEIVRNIDELLDLDSFMGFEVSDYINSGHGFGAHRGNKVIKKILDFYDGYSHLNEKGEFVYTPCPIYTTDILKGMGLKTDGRYQKVNGMTIFPNEYFDPALQIPTKNTFSIHHYSSLWSYPKKDMQKLWKKQQEYYYAIKDDIHCLE